MQEFINTISCRLSNPGLTPRAVTIFTQAMNAGHYRWGRKAKLTAAASVAIALRELHKPDSIRDISSLIDDSLKSIERAFMRVVNLLQLEIPRLDPALYLITLQSHLRTLINPSEGVSPLPPALLKVLKPLSLPTVMQTATSLAVLADRLTTSLSASPMPPTLCAILILALEAEIRTSLPHLGELAQLLGIRFGFAKGIVMSRYKTVYDLVEEWVREVPWLDQFSVNEKGRSKLSKRIIVAKGVKDVVQFQEEIWRRKVESQGKLNVEIDVDDDDCRSDDETFSSTTGSSNSRIKRGPQEMGASDRRKRHKSDHPGLDEASSFLINPLSGSLPDFDTSHSPSIDPRPTIGSAQKTLPSRTSHLPLVSYLLTASPMALSLSHKPSRLQLLTAERPGGVENIDDDELFGDGELEGFLRSDSEVAGLKEALGWDNADDDTSAHPPEKSKDIPNRTGSKKINMDALARVLQDDEDDEDRDICNLDGLEYVEAWRPLSPGGSHPDDGMDRYDEGF